MLLGFKNEDTSCDLDTNQTGNLLGLMERNAVGSIMKTVIEPRSEAGHFIDELRTSDELMVMIKKVQVPDPTSPTRESQMNQLDIKHDNRVMVDSSPLYRRLMHPTEPRRSDDWRSRGSPRSITRHPVKYYFIDFDLCRRYDPQTGPARELPGYGGDRPVPGFVSHTEEPRDPFAIDVYRLGNFIRRFLMSSQQVFDVGNLNTEP
ncbi:hypothetical protein K435DRAFT_866252 [Dendrothele bispora CBS 962.96]|uniref:Protein kinase domain-containing protein n=1 Tax=Dendrothele bispora (strain CBS 962.96) TaxID=1314807 RepID=A0A4S8LHD4_DENBC|nr:hypothetical protein K435DRAFT_866252 [Dendrothele bispora CBS 962.96]